MRCKGFPQLNKVWALGCLFFFIGGCSCLDLGQGFAIGECEEVSNGTFIGTSSDENGRKCSTYEKKRQETTYCRYNNSSPPL